MFEQDPREVSTHMQFQGTALGYASYVSSFLVLMSGSLLPQSIEHEENKSHGTFPFLFMWRIVPL